VTGYLKRLLSSGAAYQASSILSSALALFTLPLYTRYLSPAEFGYAETLLVFIIFSSILLRLGLGEAFVRYWFEDDDEDRRRRLVHTTTSFVFAATTLSAGIGVVFAAELSELLLAHRDALLMSFGLLGLWAFTNLEIAYALLRVEERRRTYLAASVSNVLLTVALTVVLVVVFDTGARGYVLGNYGASTVVLVALWISERRRLGLPSRPGGLVWTLMRFGGPTVPAEAAVYALNAIDRAYLLRVQSPGAAGLYALAAKLSMIVIIAVRGFQAAWPPLAYSVHDDDEARRLYAFVTTAYVLATGVVVAGLALLGRWVVRLIAPPDFFAAHEALPWVALGWALYGLFLLFVTIAGRAKVTTRNFPAAAVGLAVNVGALVALVGPLGIAGAGIALCVAYVAMLSVIHLATRRLFAVPFEWRRLGLAVAVLAGVSVGGELLLPDSGLDGFALRALALLLIPALLVALRFFRPEEVARVRDLLARRRGAAATEP
jgi:O-antigen/teichoic acid export membrane protein